MSYNKLIKLTLAAVYFLILIGGIVRSTGSGMGCPDWPKCFGQWIPPTSIEELPGNYKEIYSEYRERKNQRFAGFLEKIGMKETALKLRSDESILQEADFNAAKTWIEYVNRIVGMIVGLLVTIVFAGSFLLRQLNRGIIIASGSALFIVALTAWFGSIVVSTNLTPWTVTLHMLLALVTVALLVLIKFMTGSKEALKSPLFIWINLSLLLTIIQVFLGTQVREGVDQIATAISDRSAWIENLGLNFIIHRSFSWLLLLTNGFVGWKLFQLGLSRQGILILTITLASLITGAGMAWFAVPAYLQPLHLVLAAMLFGTQFGLWLNFSPVRFSSFQLRTT